MIELNGKKWLSSKEIREKLGNISDSQLCRLVRRGLPRSTERINGLYHYCEEMVNQFLIEGR